MPSGIYKRKPITETTRKLLRDSHKGLIPGNKGMKYHLKHDKQFKKGQIPWNKGTGKLKIKIIKNRKHSEEWKKNMSERLKGHIVSKETRKKLSISNSVPRPQLRGDKNNMWKGGITPINAKIRTSFEMKLWVKACLLRDDFTDAKTGQRGGELQVHHINNFADFPELRFAIDNGITLSKESHKLFHKIYGKRNNTRSQLEEFLNN